MSMDEQEPEPAAGSPPTPPPETTAAEAAPPLVPGSPRAPLFDRVRDRVRPFALPVVLVGGLLVLLATAHWHYPIHKWLFWRYAGYWVACGALSLGCLSAGHATLKRLLPAPLPIIEHLGTSFAVGIFELFLLLSLTGMLGLYGGPLFFALPLAMIGAGARPLYRYLRRCVRHVRHARRTTAPAPLWTYAVVAFGLLGMAMVYFVILTPDNVQFDSRWKHMAAAETYTVAGGIRRFPEGWTTGTYPQLPVLLYSWAFMLPFGRLFDRIELAAHLEFFVFVATTLTIPALVRLLVPRRAAEVGVGRPGARARAHLSWAVRFLFPGVFLYDSSVCGGADHIAALFVIPTFTVLIRALRELSPRLCFLLAVVIAGAIMGKYTSLMMVLPLPAIVLAVRAIVLRVRSKQVAPGLRRNWWLGPLVTLGAGLVLTSPHWLKNWVWYGDPVYPQLHGYLSLRPWTQDAADIFEWGYKDHQFWRPPRTLAGLLESLRAQVTFAFLTNDWPKFHGAVPVFGFLYTLSIACVPFFRRTRRLWGLVGCIQAALFVWYWTNHQDRYLQTIVPWMAAVTAAVLLMLWRQGIVTRVAVAALVGTQIVWGGDVYFIATHAMIRSPVKAVVELLGKGYARDYEGRLHTYPMADVGEGVPKGSVVLLHDIHLHLGIGAVTVSDFGGWQFGISYGRQKSPGAVWELLRSMGVTHLVWERHLSRGWDSIAGDLTFFNFAIKYGQAQKEYSGTLLASMPAAPPPDEPNDVVVFAGCNDTYQSGLYHLSDMTVPVYGPRKEQFPAPFRTKGNDAITALVRLAAFAVVDPKCQPAASKGMPAAGFKFGARRRIIDGKGKKLELWIRTGTTPEPPPRLLPPGPDQPSDDDDDDPTH
jgi:hypothetical protein